MQENDVSSIFSLRRFKYPFVIPLENFLFTNLLARQNGKCFLLLLKLNDYAQKNGRFTVPRRNPGKRGSSVSFWLKHSHGKGNAIVWGLLIYIHTRTHTHIYYTKSYCVMRIIWGTETEAMIIFVHYVLTIRQESHIYFCPDPFVLVHLLFSFENTSMGKTLWE